MKHISVPQRMGHAMMPIAACCMKRDQQSHNIWNLPPFSRASPDGWAVWGVVMSTRWWLLVDHCVLRNWDRILVRAVKGLISRAGMVSICPLLWQRDVKLQQTKPPFSRIYSPASVKREKIIKDWLKCIHMYSAFL